MTTKQWTSGTGDWFSSPKWLDSGTFEFGGPPQPGDTGEIFGGSVTITPADAVNHPTLDGILLDFAAGSGDAAPTLDVANIAFGAGMVIGNPATDSAALLIARGTVALAGTLLAESPGGAFTLDIESLGGAPTLASSGLVETSNTGTLLITSGASATLANSGTVQAFNGSADIGVALVNTGIADATGFGTLVLAGAVDNEGTMFAAVQTGPNQFSPGDIVIDGSLLNGGTISVVTFGTLLAAGGIANSGTISNDGGSVTLGFSLSNTGVISDQAGTIDIAGGVSGAGFINVATEVDLGGAVGAGQTVDFTSGDAMLRLSDAAGFDGAIGGMSAHDLIDLRGVAADSTTYDSGTRMLGVFDGTTKVATLQVNGLTGTLSTAPDLAGGTILTLEQAGTPAQVTQFMVANSADGQGAHNWKLPDPTITYTFDAASGWTTAEKTSFQNAMALWSDVANVTFKQVHAGTPDLVIATDTVGEAVTNTTFSGGTNESSTIEIDTAVPSWQDISDLGTSDPTGFGGYGFMTVLHELGHVMGLGHPGPYNEVADITQQLFYTDTHQYSVMSYFGANESGADWTLGTTDLSAQTPMLYDISAVQQIYGANTTDLTGGDTFGFNSTFGTTSTHPIRQYDFADDTSPVVTLYDGGPDNTLDLSGFTAPSTVDLAPGSFSSADDMTDNIAIAFGTTIDSAVGGAGDDIFFTNGGDDTIDGGGGTNAVAFSGDLGQYRIERSNGTITVSGLGATNVLTNVATLDFADASVACFARGTRIATPEGQIAVEHLVAGRDMVLTRDGRTAPVHWVGQRTIDIARHPRPWDVRPVRIRANAFAPGAPVRDLLVSPDHAMLLDGVLVPARYLVNGATILPDESVDPVQYFHIELDRHDVLLAEGAPAESFLDTGNRDTFGDGSVLRLHPEFTNSSAGALRIWRERGCAPLLLEGEALATIRARLAARAEALGYRRTRDPRLRIFTGARPLALAGRGDWVEIGLPRGADTVRLESRTWVPLHMSPYAAGDTRRLGLEILQLRLDDAVLPLDDVRLATGWHAPEPHGRWTAGDAMLHVRGARMLALRLGSGGTYWCAPARRRKIAGT